jgi:hypothetical protein
MNWKQYRTPIFITLAVIVGVALVIILGNNLHSSSKPAPKPTQNSAPATNAPQTACQAFAANGATFQADLQSLSTDMSVLGTDSANNNLSAVVSDGQSLTTDAQQLQTDTDNTLPDSTLRTDLDNTATDLLTAGTDASTGDLTGATAAISQFNNVDSVKALHDEAVCKGSAS